MSQREREAGTASMEDIANEVVVIDDDCELVEVIKLWGEAELFQSFCGTVDIKQIQDREPCLYIVKPFVDPNEAISYFNANHRRVVGVWTDGRMPRISGSELTKFIRQKDNIVPIAIVSSDEKESRAAAEAGADLIVPKPVSMEDGSRISQSFSLLRRLREGDMTVLPVLRRLFDYNRYSYGFGKIELVAV